MLAEPLLLEEVSAPTRPGDGAAPGGDPGTEAPPRENSTASFAGPGQLRPVLDINPVAQERGSFPEQFVKRGNTLLFTAETPNEGRELWGWDAERGARLVADLKPGIESSSIKSMTRMGDFVYFAAGADWTPPKLWRTDGTTAGTRELSGLLPEGTLSYTHLADVPGRLLILRDNGAQQELWSSDGTGPGSVKLWSVLGPRTFPGKMVESQGALFFVSTSGCPDEDVPCLARPELWRVDASGPRLLLKGAPGSRLSELTPWRDSVVFFLNDANGGSSLWRTEGPSSRTYPVAELEPWARPGDLIATPERLFFQAREGGLYGVWSSDGTTQGTVWLYNTLGGVDAERPPTRMTVLDGTLYFQSSSPTPSTGIDLLRTDGTREGTRRVLTGLSWPSRFLAYQGHLYFMLSQHYPQRRFDWVRTDGTPGSLERVKTFQPVYPETEPTEFTVLDGEIFFQANDGQGAEPWSSRGSASDTRLVQDILPAQGSSAPEQTTVVGDQLYFTAEDGTRGRELWISDGSAAGTRLVREFASGRYSTEFRYLRPFGSQLAVSVIESNIIGQIHSTSALWLSTGTRSGTWPVRERMVEEYWRGCEKWPYRSCAGYMTVSGDTLYITDSSPGPNPSSRNYTLFAMRDGASLQPLRSWRQFNPYSFTAFDGSLYFVAARSTDGSVPGPALWRSEGTPSSTRRVMDLPELIDSVWLGSTLYFSAPAPGMSRWQSAALWRANLERGEAQLVSTGGDTLYISPGLMAVAGGKLFFMSWNETTRMWELWVSDGTSAGTRRVKELTRSLSWSKPLMPLGNVVLYWIEDPLLGWGLWRSDGTAEGTTLLKAIHPPPLQPVPLLLPDGKRVVFQASDGVSGIEPWVTDGTAGGTFLLADLAAGPASSNPDSFAVAGNTLYFAADDQLLGRELWAVPVDVVSKASGPLGVEHTVR